MKTLFSILIISLVCTSCCTNKDCECPEPTLEIVTGGSSSEYFLIRTTKTYARIDSIEMIMYFSKDERLYYELTPYSFDHILDKSMSDFNYLIKRSDNKRLDTLSNLSYKLEPYSFECNDCFLTSDIRHCSMVTDPQVKLNGQPQTDFTVLVD